MTTVDRQHLADGAAIFYGVREQWEHLWRQAIGERRDWYYLDNAFFDVDRGTYFRAAKNAVQMSRFVDRCYPRFARGIAPWRRKGYHIVICPQSDEFMRVTAGISNWTNDVTALLQRYTGRAVIARTKLRNRRRPLANDLQGAHALVTHSSASANEALLAGIPVFVTGACAASSMASGDLSQIEVPRLSSGREHWAAAVAAHQWTLEDFAAGKAWRALQQETEQTCTMTW